MELEDLICGISDFQTMPHTEKVKILGWYLHTYKQKETFNTTDIRKCYQLLHIDPPNVSAVLINLSSSKTKDILKNSKGDCKLQRHCREDLNRKYANRPASIAVDVALKSLPGKISDEAERKYLTEAINCYSIKAFRAAIIMTWNAAYDHMIASVFVDPVKLSKFNNQIGINFTKKSGISIVDKSDFEELKEHEVITIMEGCNFIDKATKKILLHKLDRRNMCAHPTPVEITQYQAEDAITDLINNIILKF